MIQTTILVQLLSNKSRSPIDFELRGQRSRSSFVRCIRILVDRIQATVFALSLSNFRCNLLVTRGETLLILGHRVKGQGQLWHSGCQGKKLISCNKKSCHEGLIESNTTLREGPGNPIRVSKICNPRRGLPSRGCSKSWTRGWDSRVPPSMWCLIIFLNLVQKMCKICLKRTLDATFPDCLALTSCDVIGELLPEWAYLAYRTGQSADLTVIGNLFSHIHRVFHTICPEWPACHPQGGGWQATRPVSRVKW